jgi:hypothetical protein
LGLLLLKAGFDDVGHFEENLVVYHFADCELSSFGLLGFPVVYFVTEIPVGKKSVNFDIVVVGKPFEMPKQFSS